MAWLGVAAATVSIDDFYLTHAQQTALAAAKPDNRLVALRGNAGTHDLQLGRDALLQLKGCTSSGSTVALPRWVREMLAGLCLGGGASGDLLPRWPYAAAVQQRPQTWH